MTFAGVIEAFGGGTAYGLAVGITPGYARVLKSRNWIPAIYWPATTDAARRLRIKDVNTKSLARLAASKKRHPDRVRQ
jgi:hypothetical protein